MGNIPSTRFIRCADNVLSKLTTPKFCEHCLVHKFHTWAQVKNFLAIPLRQQDIKEKKNCSKLNCLNCMSISKCSWQSSNSRSTHQSVQCYLDRNGGKGACCVVWLLLVIQLSSTFKPRWGSHSLLFGSYHFNKGVSRSNAKTSGLTAFRHWHQHSGPIDSEQLSLLFTFRAC